MSSQVAALVHDADHVLVQFDGPVCPVFDAAWQRTAAQRLALLIGAGLPPEVADSGDPFAVLRFAETCGEATAHVVERQLNWLESEAMLGAALTQGVVDSLRRLFGAGYTITVVGNVGYDPIRSFLTMHDLLDVVRRVSVRGSAPKAALLPDPFLLNLALEALGASGDRCVFVTGSVVNVEAGRAAGMPVIGYATGEDEGRRFLEQGARTVIDNFAELDWQSDRSDVVPSGDLSTWREP